MRSLHRFLILGIFFTFSTTEAKVFSTDFLTVDLPEGWNCIREEVDWVCQPESLKQRSEALMVIVVKSSNEIDDTLEKYEQILKETREMFDLARKPYTSQVKYVIRKKIKNREWVDSLHLGSEIPGFYTRYLASINEKVAGLVTYSIAESVYPKYAEILNAMIESLELQFNQQAYEKAMKADPSMLPRGGLDLRQLRGTPMMDHDDHPISTEDEGLDHLQIGVIIAAAAAIAFLIWKRSTRD